MTMDKKSKKNPDYTESAVNLTNPAQVAALMEKWEELEKKRLELEKTLFETDIYKQIDGINKEAYNLEDEIRKAIDTYGSYQDIENGVYALKQRRESVTYDPEAVRIHIPGYSNAIIEEVVDKQKVKGLVKGGLITDKQLKDISVVSETFVYIIK